MLKGTKFGTRVFWGAVVLLVVAFVLAEAIHWFFHLFHLVVVIIIAIAAFEALMQLRHWTKE